MVIDMFVSNQLHNAASLAPPLSPLTCACTTCVELESEWLREVLFFFGLGAPRSGERVKRSGRGGGREEKRGEKGHADRSNVTAEIRNTQTNVIDPRTREDKTRDTDYRAKKKQVSPNARDGGPC
jgi:hypothetical protein